MPKFKRNLYIKKIDFIKVAYLTPFPPSPPPPSKKKTNS